MIKVKFYDKYEVDDSKIKYSVICAKYSGKWVFSRHISRTTWEIPGGHREIGENTEECAKRELFEETGAVKYIIKSVSVYGVSIDGEESFGELFYAEIETLGQLPDFEIAEIMLSDSMPENQTYPNIQPELYNYVQGWLNIQTSEDEMWDLFDEKRNPLGIQHRRGDMLRPGEYHTVVHVWIKNSEGKYLLTKRTPNKGFGNMWECTGGSAVVGENSITSAMREVKEETGLELDKNRGKLIKTYRTKNDFVDVWLFCQDFSLDEVTLLEGETCDAMFAEPIEILKMLASRSLVPVFPYLSELFDYEK